MIYCRFNSDSDVYMYLSKDGWECCKCSLSGGDEILLRTPSIALEHLAEHQRNGDAVPAQAVVDLRHDVDVLDIALSLSEKASASYQSEACNDRT